MTSWMRAGVVAGLCASATPVAQTPQPAFRARTLATELEIRVRTVDGVPVDDLRLEDVELREDGERQTLLSLDPLGPPPTASHTSSPPTTGTRRSGPLREGEVVVASNTDARRARAWALIVDDLRVAGFLRDKVKQTLRTLVDEMGPDDYVAIVPVGQDRRAAREFTRDRASLHAAIDALRFPMPLDGYGGVADMGTTPSRFAGPTAPPFTSTYRLDLPAADNRLVSTIGDVAQMLGRSGAARRSMVMVGGGLRVLLSDDYRGLLENTLGTGTLLRRYDELVQALDRIERGGATFHVIDPTAFDAGLLRRTGLRDNLEGPSNQVHARRSDPHFSARVMAARTGGLFVGDQPSPEAAARAVLATAWQGYVVRYMPTRDDPDDRRRVVDVRVTRPGLVVQTREAYARVADVEFEAQRREKPLGVAVASVLPSDALSLEAHLRLVPGTPRGRWAFELDVRVTGRGDGTPLEPSDEIELLAVAVDAKGRTVSTVGGSHPVSVQEGHLRLPTVRLEPLGRGPTVVRVAARSVRADLTGSVFLEVDVPKR